MVTVVSDRQHASSGPGALSTWNGEWNLDKWKTARRISNVIKNTICKSGKARISPMISEAS